MIRFFTFLAITGLILHAHDGLGDVKARAGFFIPVESLFRDIYGDVGPTFELESSQRLFRRSPLVWENVGITAMNGHSTLIGDNTNIVIANFSFGAKLIHRFRYGIRAYGGLGGVVSGVWIENSNSSCCEKTSKCVFGGVLKLSVQRPLTSTLFFELFGDYYVQPVHFDSQVDIGGFRGGFGLSYGF